MSPGLCSSEIRRARSASSTSLLAVDRDDDVAADGDLRALEADLLVAALMPASSAGLPGTTSAISAPVLGVDVEPVGELGIEAPAW